MLLRVGTSNLHGHLGWRTCWVKVRVRVREGETVVTVAIRYE